MRTVLVVFAAAALGSACGGAGAGGGAAPDATTDVRGEAKRCRSGTVMPLGRKEYALAAEARGRTTAFDAPAGTPLHVFPRLTSLGATTVFAIRAARVDDACEPTWLRVQLPIKPNGIVGWVRASDVRVYRVATRLLVDLSQRRLELTRSGRRVLAVEIGVGAARTPTPTGSYYVNQKVRVTPPVGPFGPAALGISAFSPVLTGWAEGGPVAVHGTNDPASIGRAASTGCIRVTNDVVRRLFRLVPAGTPVVIRA